MQPSFYYATVLMIIALFISALLIRINGFFGPRWRSIMLLAPLVAAILVLIIFPPTLSVPILPETISPLVPQQMIERQLSPGVIDLHDGVAVGSVLSVTGLLVIVGLGLGALSLIISLLFSYRVTRRLLQVVDLEREDFPDLAADIEELAARMGIRTPSLGLVEDLRPNAFTFGTGRRATVVFSLGILTILDRREVKAVAAHELAHIKNRDVWFKACTRGLAWAFFFNPAAHLSAKAAHREREHLADETARSVLGERKSLIRAIEKVTRACRRDTVRPTLASRLGLKMALSLAERSSLMSDHPSLAERTRQFSEEQLRRRFTPAACLMLSAAVILTGVVLAVSTGEVRADIIHSVLSPPGPVDPLHDSGPHLMNTRAVWTDLKPVDRSMSMFGDSPSVPASPPR
jgi:heat shock protein HtpX